MTTRRHVLQWLAAAPALGGCGEGPPDPASAWRDPGAGERDPRRFALAHAILAPNPHNTQPWLVELDREDGMTLWCDLDRRLPFTDPFDRQITMGCGCFLELYRIAAAVRGFTIVTTPFPEGAPARRLDSRPIANVRLIRSPPRPSPPDLETAKQAARDVASLNTILARRTNRNAYDVRRLPAERSLANIARSAGATPLAVAWTLDPARVAQLRDLVWRAFDRELRTRGAQEETYRWLRFGREEVARRRDGLAIEGPMVPLFKALGFLDLEDFLDPDSTANKQAADDWRRKAETSPAFMWLATPNDAPATRLETGMAYARMNLAATSAGLAMHPWSQALQEYDEMRDLYAEARELLEAGDNTVQMLVRVGYAAPTGPSARRGVEAIMREPGR